MSDTALDTVPEQILGGSSWDSSAPHIMTIEEHELAESSRSQAERETAQRSEALDKAHRAFRAKNYVRFLEIVGTVELDSLSPVLRKRIEIAKKQA